MKGIKPGPLGYDGKHDALDDGTMCRSASPKPGPIDGSPSPQSNESLGSEHRFAQRPSLPRLQMGNTGANVRKLQSFLNLRLDLRPELAVNGYFWPPTHKAVVEFQKSRAIKADGVVENTTWYHLIIGTPAKQIPTKAPVPQSGKGGGAPPAPEPSFARWRPPTDSVMDWPLRKKFKYAVDKVPSDLSGELESQVAVVVDVQSLAIKLEAMAYCELFEVAKRLERGMNVIDEPVFQELAHTTPIIALATTQSELDEAAADLAEEVKLLGVPAVVDALARFDLGEGGGTTERRPEPITRPHPKRPPPPPPPAKYEPPASVQSAPVPVRPPRTAPSPPVQQVHWITVSLLRKPDKERPSYWPEAQSGGYAGVFYDAELPDRKEKNQPLDENGTVFREGLHKSGDCAFTFKDFYKDIESFFNPQPPQKRS